MRIKVERFSFTYPSGVRALQNISFQVDQGERLAVLGPNGAGKSTLLLCLARLIGGKGGEGTITWNDPEGKAAAPGSVGFLFQNPDDQIIGATVEDDVGFVLLRDGIEPEKARPRVREALTSVHLEGYEERVPLELSFGEKKRLGLAGLLVKKPDLLCLDEPALGLDFREKNQLLMILRNLSSPMVMASMDLELVAGLAHRALILDRGELVAEGKPARLLFDRNLMETHGLRAIKQ